MHSRASLQPIGQEEGYNPSWPPREPERRTGKATRVMDFNPKNDDFLHSLAGRHNHIESILGDRTDQAAKSMASAQSAMTRLVERTIDDNKAWSPGKKTLAGPVSDVGTSSLGYNVVRPEPLIIRGKVRRGCANAETTNIITREITEREQKRQHDAEAAERSKPFHSYFSEQPRPHAGTAHVKPVWAGTFSLNQQQQPVVMQSQSQPVFPSYGGGAVRGGSNSQGFLPSIHDSKNNNNNMSSSNTGGGGGELPPLAGAPGLPGFGQADAFRSRQAHHGKKQIDGAHRVTSLVDGQKPIGFDFRRGYNSNSSTPTPAPEAGDFHQKLPDGSRGLRVAPQRNMDQVRDTFAADPAALMRRERFVTTSSSVGNPEMRGYVPADASGCTRGGGPNTRHFVPSQSSAFPPVGASSLASAAFRSATPFPMPANAPNHHQVRSRSSLR